MYCNEWKNKKKNDNVIRFFLRTNTKIYPFFSKGFLLEILLEIDRYLSVSMRELHYHFTSSGKIPDVVDHASIRMAGRKVKR